MWISISRHVRRRSLFRVFAAIAGLSLCNGEVSWAPLANDGQEAANLKKTGLATYLSLPSDAVNYETTV